ncbi:MAG: PKD domain-containing protein, partial [Bacteroidota bacterium]
GVVSRLVRPHSNTDRLGIYWVEVVDQNGCIGVSNRLNLSDCEAIGGTCVNGRCVGSPPPPCVFSGDLDFEIRRTTDCRRHLYVNNSFGFIPGSIRWDFGDVASGPNNRSTDFSPEHTFEGGARFYVIKLRASFRATDGSICPIELWKNDTIPLVADFEALGACSGSDVQFNDLSNFLPFTSIVSWKWNFGDPASGAQNVSRDTDPIHVYNSPGTYTVELLVEEQSGCRSAITKQVTIYDPPTIDFDPPDENCISNAMNFRALVSPRVTKVAWDFGDPASGASNQSESFNTYHSFSNPGRYTVELRAEDQSGCKSVTSRVIEVTGNSLTAAIDASPNPPVCSGDSVVLSADTNGPTLLWSTGANSSSITVRESDVYSLTVSDAEGCVAKAPPIPVDFTELPEATIRAVRYNQFKSPAAYFYDSYAVCEGEDVFLEVDGVDRGYIYRWSTGLLGTEVEFSEENDKLLEAGDHLFTLTVTDRQTRCENTIGPFLVRVHPLPDSIEILASDARTICESTPVTYFVNNPQAGITYIWNNGETGTSMTTDVAGEYYVLGFNANGCRAESNRMIIKAGPNVVSIPSGCHIRCRPDTLCFPEIPGIASYQWYFNGAIVPGPEGQQPDFLPQESGTYYLEMIDTSGCLATSADLTIQLNDGLGTINGEVYFDLNQNGMIDAGDTLMSGIPIVILNDGMVAIDSAFSNGGLVLFDRLPSSKDYSLILDSLGLPPNTRAIQVQQDASLFGCDDEELVQWLVIPYCVTQTHSLALLACPGDSATYDGQRWAIGSRQDVTFLTSGGCDSIVSLQVNALPEYLEQVNLTACLGSRITYNGMDLPSDTTAMLRYQTVAGCDSLIEVRVSSLPRDSSSLSLEVCGDNPVDYDGVTLRAGDRRLFNYTNSSGCDSLLFVLVDSVPEYYERVALTACAGSRITYNGMDLPSDTMAMLRYQTVAGCDSLIEVRVSSLPRDSSSMSLEVCGDNPVNYDGVTLRAGDRRLFNYTNSAGCDSLLLVLVDSVPEYYEQVALTACTGSRITYNGMDLPSDTTAMLRYQTVAGCDSLIEVRVSSLPRDSSSMSLEVCGDNPVDYDGVT